MDAITWPPPHRPLVLVLLLAAAAAPLRADERWDRLVPPPPPARRTAAANPPVVPPSERAGARPRRPPAPAADPPPKSARLESLRTQITRTLAAYERRPLNTADNNPWEVMHWAIASGASSQLRLGGPAGDLVTSLGWLNMGGRCNGLVMLARQDGRLVALRGKGMQGHVAQYLAVLAQCRVARASPIELDGRHFTVGDLVETERRSLTDTIELTFPLIALSHYLATDETWPGADGTTWSLPRIVAVEIGQPLRGAACGGSHRLFGLAYACQKRREAKGTLDGVFVAADRYVRGQQQRMFHELQNDDGSFSTDWFNRSEDGDDVERKLRTSGHMLEFLVSTADQGVLYHPRTVAAVEFVAGILAAEPGRAWKIGPMCHALHGLAIYQERVWGVVSPHAVAAYHGAMKARGPEPRLAAAGR